MKTRAILALVALSLFVLSMPVPASATDVDGPDDCVRELIDFGDAPENAQAYAGIMGHFPTCLFPGAPGTQEIQCGTPRCPPPGAATGFVRHIQFPQGTSYWLGCIVGGPPLGIDSEPDGKMNDNGSAFSLCNEQVTVDCIEPAFGLNFGQDECYGTDDAGLSAPVTFNACLLSSVVYRTYNCAPYEQEVYLNILVDWNQDGDWCDNLICTDAVCAYEWAVVNHPIVIPPGCTSMVSPQFTAGPYPGRGWMRISLSSVPVPNDFPWNGTAGLVGEAIEGGETEDYPVNIEEGEPCPEYLDFGDAPEDDLAYPSGVVGRFPTCIYQSPPGTQQIAAGCTALSTAPGPTGHVVHRRNLEDPMAFWLGCWQPFAIDGEPDGKMNASGASASNCDPRVLVDCIEPAFGGMNFGQDECVNDGVDAGLLANAVFNTCTQSSVTFDAFNCASTPVDVVLNVLVDWNEDGDWNDVLLCPQSQCAPEWVVKNHFITLNPGCQQITTPQFLAGPRAGPGWMRITLTAAPVPDDFPWNGSLGTANGEFEGGETEDYPVVIESTDPCPEYQDLGDAPEDVQAYPGIAGHFPTCRYPGPAGTQELAAGCPAISTPPGATGHVEHVRVLNDPFAFWLGCGSPPAIPGVDSEPDGKMNDTGNPVSWCDQTTNVDCFENAFGLTFGQDECYGDVVDAGIRSQLIFDTCKQATVPFDAMNCGAPVDVYLNILVDWNEDGDWNDSFLCPNTGCAYEWAVKNAVIALPTGCTPMVSPSFLVGPRAGNGWLRITLTATPVPDDFPWNGSAGNAAAPVFEGGETEDYPVVIELGEPCEEPYLDFGDAPEEVQAYPGVIGHFPTCRFPGAPGTQEIECSAPVGTQPGITGWVMHMSNPQPLSNFWLGCPDPASGFPGVDGESDGKMNDTGALISACNDNQPVDCIEPVWLPFGQDECTGDLDAGVKTRYAFPQCTVQSIRFDAYNCGPPREAFVNILIDWNRDGDWNDNILCPYTNFCAPEWAVQNQLLTLQSGCATYSSALFRVGPHEGPSWMRVTLSDVVVPNDFAWAGTANLVGEQFIGGETEDYPVEIVESPVGVIDMPLELAFAPAVPNPTRGTTTLRFTLPAEMEVTLAAYDVQGRKVRALRGGTHSAGAYAVTWDFTSDRGSRLPVGVYIVKLTAGEQEFTQRVIRTR